MPTTTESLVAEAPVPAPQAAPADRAKEIQGNIIHSFGCQYATYVFFRFIEDAGLVRKNLKSLLPGLVTTAARQTIPGGARSVLSVTIPGDYLG